jgi:hypothetical protein
MAAVGHAELHILAPRSAEESSSVMQRAAMHLLSPMTLAITTLSKSLEVSSNHGLPNLRIIRELTAMKKSRLTVPAVKLGTQSLMKIQRSL